jgi:hypothetical protein
MGDDDDSNSSNSNHGVVDIVTPKQMLSIGLKVLKYSVKQLQRTSNTRNRERFTSHFGSSPRVCAMVYEDLQRTAVEEARIQGSEINVRWFLIAMHFLKVYPTEDQWESLFNTNIHWTRDKVWMFVEKIHALKAEKIVWPEDDFGSLEWVITVDGTHCWIKEPQHPSWSQDRRYYSHKFNKAGLNYELGIALNSNKLVWMNGPFPAGSSDSRIFKREGLKTKLNQCGKKAIGDAGYVGHQKECCTPNSHDSRAVRKFKSRALKRHEKFNGYTKVFGILHQRFRHSVPRFTLAFEAVCVICQYQLDCSDKYLFDILVEDIFEEYV